MAVKSAVSATADKITAAQIFLPAVNDFPGGGHGHTTTAAES